MQAVYIPPAELALFKVGPLLRRSLPCPYGIDAEKTQVAPVLIVILFFHRPSPVYTVREHWKRFIGGRSNFEAGCNILG